jgi:photosystem II biogenesis protein Psp29
VDQKVRTVSDSKRDFYTHYTRPINSIYRRVVEELLVEMHLLSVNVDFRYDPIYALGVVSAYQQLLQGYRPEADKEAIFTALCQAVGGNAATYRQDAQQLLQTAQGSSLTALLSREVFQSVRQAPKFKYSRLFGIGLYTLLLEIDGEIAKDKDKREAALREIAQSLPLPPEKLQKDLELYRSNLEKLAQLLGVIEEALTADRKKREAKDTPLTPLDS